MGLSKVDVFGLNASIVEHYDNGTCYGYDFNSLAGEAIDRVQEYSDSRLPKLMTDIVFNRGIFLNKNTGFVFSYEMYPFYNSRMYDDAVIILTAKCNQTGIPLIRRVKMVKSAIKRMRSVLDIANSRDAVRIFVDSFDFYKDAENWYFKNVGTDCR